MTAATATRGRAPRRCPPTSSTGACSRPPRSKCSAASLRRPRACARSTGRSSRCRSTAGSAGSTPPTSRRLALAEPPVLDLGCGPGRHLAALREAGKRSLGLDLSPVAVRLARRRGGAAIRGDVFGSVPGAGRYRTVLLLDGNVGIGGAPDLLLRRTRELLAPGGAALVELDPPGRPTFTTRIRLEAHGAVSEWFAWARVGVDGIAPLAARGGLEYAGLLAVEGRWIAVLRRP